LGINLSLQEIKKGYEESALKIQAKWKRNEHVSTIEQIRLILQASSLGKITLPRDPQAIELLERAYVDPVFDFAPKLNDEALATLEGMKSRAREIGLISNTGRSPAHVLRELIGKFGILKFFDTTTFSDEVGWRKPDKRIFEAAASQLGTDLKKMIHIGDDPEADARGAKQAGMRALLLDYAVLDGFKRQPSSLFALTRADTDAKDSEMGPDGRINSLKEALDFVDSLG
jgi:putative hydrolase of the HAD superfamily